MRVRGVGAWAQALRALLARHGGWIAWALLFAATIYAYRGVASLGFTDEDALVDFTAARVGGVGGLLHQLDARLTASLAAGNANFYRPVVMLHFALQRAVLGFSGRGFQIWDLCLHLGVVAMVGWLVTSLGGGKVEAWTAGAIVALHPLGVEIVPAVARNIDLLLALFVLGALIAAARGRPVAAGVLGLLALGSKELGITVLPLVVAVYALLHGRKGLRALILILGIGVPLFLLERTRVLGGWGGYTGSLIRMDDAARLWSCVSWEILFPGWSQELGRTLPTYRLQMMTGAPLLAALPAAAWWSWRRGDRRPAVGVALLLLPMVLLAITSLLVRRLYYVPMIGTAVALAAWLRDPILRWPSALVVLSLLPASPLLHPDRSWADNDRVTRSITSAVEPELAALPDGSTVWLVDLCERMDSDPLRFRTFIQGGASGNNCATRRSIQAWAVERFGYRVRVRTLTSVVPRGPLPAPDLVAGADGVVIRRPPMQRAAHEAPEWSAVTSGGRLVSLRPRADVGPGRILVAGGEKGVLLDIGPISFEDG